MDANLGAHLLSEKDQIIINQQREIKRLTILLKKALKNNAKLKKQVLQKQHKQRPQNDNSDEIRSRN